VSDKPLLFVRTAEVMERSLKIRVIDATTTAVATLKETCSTSDRP